MSLPEVEDQAAELFPSPEVWVEEEGRVHLVGGRCTRCGKVAFSKRTVCDQCGSVDEIDSTLLSNVGTLYSFSEVHVAPKGFRTPYVIGYVDLPEGVRVFGQIEHSASELHLDDVVEVVLGVIRLREDGRPVVSYKFRKQGGAGSA